MTEIGRVAASPLNLTSKTVSPAATALTQPLASTVATKGFVLDQEGAGPDGGIPGPKTTNAEKGSMSPIRSLALSGTISTDMTGAISAGPRLITLAGDVGDIGDTGDVRDSLQPTSTSEVRRVPHIYMTA